MNDRFVRAALLRNLISDEQAATLLQRGGQSGSHAGQLAIELGIMSSTDVEIAEAFMDPDDLVPGFRLVDVLGAGALGVVYHAHQDRLQRDVAIKAILQSRLSQANVLQRFQKEATAIGRLHHPNIVGAFDSGTHQGRVYLVMELVRGEDLRHRIRQGPISVDHAISITRQAALGLAHAAAHQIIHRDIKPANLILTDAPTGFDLPPGAPLAKIADFGLARLNDFGDDDEEATALTMTGATLGTPMYCAPEQLTGDPVDHRADIYGLGATLFTMLTSETPFENTALPKLVAAKVTGDQPRFELLPGDLEAAVQQLVIDMMHHDPEKRISNYDTLIDRIDKFDGARRSTAAVAKSKTLRAASTRKRSATWMLVATAVVGMTALALAARNTKTIELPKSVETLWSEHLFDGKSLGGWTNHQSIWSVSEDGEGSRVLAGKGRISRPIPTLPPNVSQSLVGRGLRTRVALHEAESVEVQFAFSQDRFWSVRVTSSDVSLGHRSVDSDNDKFVAAKTMKVDSTGSGEAMQWHEVQWQRRQGQSFVLFDGKTLGSFRQDELTRDELQFVATGGEAYFSDISIFGLESPQ